VYARVAELRDRLRLTDEAMAVTGCDGPTTEAVLGRVLGWYQANAAAWDSRRSAVMAATGQLRLALGRMHAGPAALATATGAGGPGGAARGAGGAGGSATTVESLVAEVQAAQAAVSAAEKAESDLLAAAAENVGAAMSDAQRSQWAAIRANPAGGGEYSLLAGITADQLTAQAQSLAATRDALRRNLPAVLAASAKVLPPPPRRLEVVDRTNEQKPWTSLDGAARPSAGPTDLRPAAGRSPKVMRTEVLSRQEDSRREWASAGTDQAVLWLDRT
jgi:hypothetical protein